jgi:hypothetical protein
MEMRTTEQIKADITNAENGVYQLKQELRSMERAEMDARAEAGKNDPTSGFYTGYAKDAWGYPLDPLMND